MRMFMSLGIFHQNEMFAQEILGHQITQLFQFFPLKTESHP